MSKKCTNCGVELEDDDMFCSECGTKQEAQAKKCLNCGAELKEGAKFCMMCGTPVGVKKSGVNKKSSSLSTPDTAIISQPDEDTIGIEVLGVKFNMKFVQGGMLDNVELSDYYMGETMVTQELWQMVIGSNPSKDNSNLLKPVMDVTPAMCISFLLKLKKLTGQEFSLPTSCQREWAYKGGVKSKGFIYPGSNRIDEVAWTEENSGNEVHPVAELVPNELGIYDLEGNVCELVYEVEESEDCAFNPQGEEVSSEGLDALERTNPVGFRLVINIPVSEERLKMKKGKSYKD